MQIPDTQKGLVGHWSMNSEDTDNGKIRDRSAYDNHGTLQNGPTTGNPSPVGDSYGFDGNDDRVKIDNVPTNSTSEVTVSAWVYITGNAGNSWERHVDLQNGSGGQIVVLRWDDDGAQYGFQALGADADVNEDPPQNVWLHWVGVVRNGTAYFYEDTVQKATGSTGGSSTASSSVLGIGNRYDGNDHVLANMSDVRIYNRALSQSEINQLYNKRTVGGISTRFTINATHKGNDVVLERDAHGTWLLVMNYEHYGGEDPESQIAPGSTFPQMPNGRTNISDVNALGTSGELKHVDNISQYGITGVDAVRLEGETSNHDRKINYFTENQTVIDAVVADNTTAEHSDLKDQVTRYANHTAYLPGGSGDGTSQTSSNTDRIFGYEFPMYSDIDGNGNNEHWAMSGNGNRWEVDDYPNNASKTTIHRVWVRI